MPIANGAASVGLKRIYADPRFWRLADGSLAWPPARPRVTRQVERLERHVTISNEALALFVRFWLTVTPPLPDTAQPAAQAKGRERYEGFVEALGRRMAKGQSLAQEISQDVISRDGSSDRTDSSA